MYMLASKTAEYKVGLRVRETWIRAGMWGCMHSSTPPGRAFWPSLLRRLLRAQRPIPLPWDTASKPRMLVLPSSK